MVCSNVLARRTRDTLDQTGVQVDTPLLATRRALLRSYIDRGDVVEGFDRVRAFIWRFAPRLRDEVVALYVFSDLYDGAVLDLGVPLDYSSARNISYCLRSDQFEG